MDTLSMLLLKGAPPPSQLDQFKEQQKQGGLLRKWVEERKDFPPDLIVSAAANTVRGGKSLREHRPIQFAGTRMHGDGAPNQHEP